MSSDRSIFQTITHHLFGDTTTSTAIQRRREYDEAIYEDIKKYYTRRRYKQMYDILDNEEKWKDFHTILHNETNGGVTNSSVIENLLAALRTDQKLATTNRQQQLHDQVRMQTKQHYQNLHRIDESSLDIPSVCSCDSSCSSDSHTSLDYVDG
jgi:hypothetical protein